MNPTTSRPSDWTPAVVTYVRCPDCGGMRRASLNPHAPRWQDGKQVDCAGREVAR